MRDIKIVLTVATTLTLVACGRLGFDSKNSATINNTAAGTCIDKTYNNFEQQIDCGGPNCMPCPKGLYASCKVLLDAAPISPSGTYQLDPDGEGILPAYSAYCEMIADGGGWTLALKASGTTNTFEYESDNWINTTTINESSAGLEQAEAKLASFSTIPAKSIRVGMTYNATTNWISSSVANDNGFSLQQIFESNTFYPTSAGRAAWVSLIAGSAVQMFCNQEGLNNDLSSAVRVRVGLLANDLDDCATPDMWGEAGSLMLHVVDLKQPSMAPQADAPPKTPTYQHLAI